MKIYPLMEEERANSGFTHVAKITYADLSDTAGLTKTLAIYPESGTAPAGLAVHRVAAKVVTAFVGCTTLGVEVGGVGSDVDAGMASFDCKSTAGTYKYTVPSTCPHVYNTADTLDALFTATVDNLSALSVGEVWIYFAVADLGKLG